jgi:lysophospholipase L1-like esterase
MDKRARWLGRILLLGVGVGVGSVAITRVEKAYQVHETKIVTRPVFNPPGLKYAQTVAPEMGRVRGWVVGMDPPARRPGTRRALAVGDSLTWGLGVTLDESWPTQLDGMLPDWEVYNLGMCGYDAEQAVSLVTSHLSRWQPDLIIWGHYANDVDPTFLMFGAHDEHPVFVGTSIPEPARMLPEALSLWLVRHSAMFRQVQAAKLARVLAGGFTPTAPTGWYAEQLAALRTWSAQTGTPILVLALPDHTQADPERCPTVISEKDCRDQENSYRHIATSLAGAGLPWVDGQRIYAASGQPHFMGADRDMGHPTPEGHRVLARGLVPQLRGLGR